MSCGKMASKEFDCVKRDNDRIDRTIGVAGCIGEEVKDRNKSGYTSERYPPCSCRPEPTGSFGWGAYSTGRAAANPGNHGR